MRLASNNRLVDHLLDVGALKTEKIIAAFKAVDRACFVPASLRVEAYEDYPLPIGLGQTISQPSTVAFMLELLQPQFGENVLEVGAGSGYVAALLSEIVGAKGLVVAVERQKELTNLAKQNLRHFKFEQLKVITADGSLGYPDYAPYQRIIISAAAPELPEPIQQQLAPSGRMVIPVGTNVQSIVLIERQADGFTKQSYPGFVFVPLIRT